MSLPTFSSAADTVPTLAMSALPSTCLELDLMVSTAVSTAFAIPFLRIIGFAPAAMFFIPSRMIACASRVAVVVPSPAASLVLVATSLTSCAPMFSKASSSSISFAMVTPSLVMSGAPNFLSRTTFLPFGPSVILTVSASLSIPACRALRASSPYLISLAIANLSFSQNQFESGVMRLRSPECPPDQRGYTPHRRS